MTAGRATASGVRGVGGPPLGYVCTSNVNQSPAAAFNTKACPIPTSEFEPLKVPSTLKNQPTGSHGDGHPPAIENTHPKCPGEGAEPIRWKIAIGLGLQWRHSGAQRLLREHNEATPAYIGGAYPLPPLTV